MATKRLPMRKLREILRLKWLQGRSHRQTASSLGVSAGAVASAVGRAKVAELDWEAVEALDDEQLDIRLYGPRQGPGVQRPLPEPTWIHKELGRKGVTLELLHLEYLEEHPTGYRYTAFTDHYRRWRKQQRIAMRQVHKAGERLFVDYSGKKPMVADPQTGELVEVEIFVAVLGASNYTYAEATRTQKGPDFIASHVRALEYIDGVPQLSVPDQLLTGVNKPSRYEPILQRTYEDLATHYGTTVLPARPGKPQDKAKVETGVQVSQRWILARLRNETFFSLAALNLRIRELLDALNARPMQSYGGQSRRERYEELDHPALASLPSVRFVYADWKAAKVNIDYHIALDKHFYSVPYTLRGEAVELRYTATTVEVIHKGHRVASHRRSYQPGRHTTDPAHMPKAHREHLEWSPSRLIRWGGQIGPQTRKLVIRILDSRRHPEQGYRTCLGLLRLAKRYNDDRLEAACARALRTGACSYRHVASILKNNLDQLPPQEELIVNDAPIEHDNLRGPDYYSEDKTTDAN